MALVYPGSVAIPRYESSLAAFLPAFEKGQAERRDSNAFDAAARAFGGGQGAAQPQQSALERLLGFGQSGGPFTRPEAAASPANTLPTNTMRMGQGDVVSQSHAAAAGAVDPSRETYFANARKAESGGNDAAKNPNSSALGRYQFLDSTWRGLMEQYPELGLTADGRTDPAQQERAMARFTQDNARTLASAGLPVNPGTLYAAHFLGAGGASNVLGQDPSSLLSAYVPADVIAANPHLNGMTVADFTEWANSKGGGGGNGGYSPPMRNEGQVPGARQFTPDADTMRTLLASEATRPLAFSLIQAQQQADASRGRYVVEEGPDGAIWQRDTLTGEQTVLQAPTKAAEAPSSVREYEFARSQGYDGTFQDWQAANKAGTSVTVNTGEGSDAALNKALSTKEGETWSGFKESAAVSASNAQDFEILNELLQLAPQGPITGRLADTFKGFSAAGDAANSIIKRIAPTLRAPGSGATSDIEYAGMLQSLPSLAQNPEANAMVLSIMQAKAQINMERGRIVTAYQNGEMDIGDARRAMDELNSRSIMTPDMRRALLGLGGDGNVAPAQDQPVGEGTVIEDDQGNQLILRNGQWEPVI